MLDFHSILRKAALACVTVAAVTAVAFAADTEMKTGVATVVDASSLRLREAPSTDSAILATAPLGDTVVVISQEGDWYQVDYNLKTGYMYGEYLSFKSVETVDLGSGFINSTLVNMREAPTTEAPMITQLSFGTEVNIIGIHDGWFKITIGDYIGYVRSDLLDLGSAPEENSSGVGGEVATTVVISTGEQIATFAQNYLGVPYVWGGTTTSGFDCSGFTQYVYKQFGYTLNRIANAQMENGYAVGISELAPGDLVFFGNTYYSSETATHVGIYIGGNQFVHAASGGVKITDLDNSYYSVRYVGARRIV